MSQSKVTRIILGNQLFPTKYFNSTEEIFMAEDYGLCTHYCYHKHKIILFLAAMRDFAAQLAKKDFSVHYQQLSAETENISYFEALKQMLKKVGSSSIKIYEIEDKFFESAIISFCEENKISLSIEKTPAFLTSRYEFEEYLSSVKSPFMKTFYERQRKKYDVLMEEGEPLGGKYSFDDENRKKLPKKIDPPVLKKIEDSPILKEVKELVETLFTKHPGKSADFWLPISRSGALSWLKDFLDQRFANFGPYEDAITDRSDVVFHSVLSPLINLGLLTPREVLDRVLSFAEEKAIPIASVEGFVRQLIGWREFVRGIYQNYSEKQETTNFWKHSRKLNDCWYEATTDLPPLDNALEKAIRLGYNHHIERLMIISNCMLLCEVDPKEAHRWFMEMYVDSSDWVMGPNVYGMAQFSDGGIFATKPYICGSNYIRKMSYYPKGDWCDVMDGLYWSFIDKRRDFYAGNHRTRMMIPLLDKLDIERRDRIFSAAEKFKEKVTLNA